VTEHRKRTFTLLSINPFRRKKVTEQPSQTAERPEQPQQPQQQTAEVVLNDKEAHAAYSNFARVTATPEEVIIDFGLNPNPFLNGKQDVRVTQRLIMNFYTAKRLCSALAMTLQRHEGTFGNVELDVRRRAQPSSLVGSR
jgi:hypothetical protein